jgi:hypothetical protein
MLIIFAAAQAPTPSPPASRPTSRPASPPPDPAEFARRRDALKDDDIEARLTLARWARDRQMWTEAVDVAQAALYLDPHNRAAYLILQQVDEARPLPPEPIVETELKAELQQRFNREFKTRSTPHFLLCYDTTDTFAAGRGAVMERIYQAFQFYFNMSTLRPEFPTQRMIVILLKNRDDYLAYLAQNGHTGMDWSAGFYAQRLNRAVYFDDTSGPTAASYAKQAADLRSKMADLTRQIADATAKNDRRAVHLLSLERNSASETLNQLNLRAGNAIIMLNNTKAMHEAAHQVAFNIGVQARLVDYPTWFSEGLACSFETEDALGRKGPAIMNYGRITGLKQALQANKLIPVEAFVRAGSPPSPAAAEAASLTAYYAQSWALFHFLYRNHRAGMEQYILAYKSQRPARPLSPDDRLRLFRESFGNDLDALHKKFEAYCRSLPPAPPTPAAPR